MISKCAISELEIQILMQHSDYFELQPREEYLSVLCREMMSYQSK